MHSLRDYSFSSFFIFDIAYMNNSTDHVTLATTDLAHCAAGEAPNFKCSLPRCIQSVVRPIFCFLPFELRSSVLDQKQTDFNKVDRLGTSLVQTTIWRFAMGNLLPLSFFKSVIILACTDTTGRIYCSSNSERLYHSVVLFVWMELMQLMFYFTVSVRQPSK